MSTPEEQQRYERDRQRYEQQQYDQQRYEQQQYGMRQQHEQDQQQPPSPHEQQQGGSPQQYQDPYGTQTWQSDTWDTGYQPVHAPLGAVPGQPVAPEGWFRDEDPAPAPARDWSDPAPAPVQDWSAPAPAAQEWSAPAPAEDWSHPAPAAEQTAYLPPYPGRASGSESGPAPQSAAPEGWFREEAAEPAPAPGWTETTAYLPPQAAEPPAEQTAYLPPVSAAQPPAEQTAYLPPVSAAQPVSPLPAGEAPEYSPPTLGGNTLRAVDPAQARAEGRSPIIDPGPQPAVLTAVLGSLLAAAAALGQYALLLPLVLLQGLTAAGWFRLNGMWPARQGIALAFAGALVADAAVLAVDGANGPGAIIGTLGAWVLLTLVLQLRSHADPDERMYGLMASVASAALAIVCAGYLAADTAAVTVGAAAVAVAVFARALPLPAAPSVGVSLAAAAGAGIAVGPLSGTGVGGGALLGLVAGVCALVGLRVAAYDYPSKFVHMTAGVALPLAVAAPAVYLIGRVVG